ncbi:MAG TPA: glycoside hydrolase family 104 protein [Solimonas sp.]
MADPIELIAAREHPNVRAFLRMLRHGEGTAGENGYRVMFGGDRFLGADGVADTFDDFADHPRRAITRRLGGAPITSTAAGAYQFLSRTWDGLVKQYGFADFTPTNQDLGAIALIKGRKALEDVIAGRFEAAVMKCNKEWASLPGSPYGQPVVTMARARQEYEAHGGTYAEPAPAAAAAAMALKSELPLVHLGPEPAPVEGVPPNPFINDQEAPMAPFLAAALPAVISAVPELARMFSSGSPTSERNIKAAEVVVNVAKEAIGARNEQELVETLQADPGAAAVVRQAVKDNWFKLEEVGGGIQAAREMNAKMQGDKGIQHNPAVWVSMVLLIFPFMLLVDVFYVHPDAYSGELRTQIITAILAVIMMVGAYWLGTSASSKAKDEALLKR